jgi:hypothetical protein
MENKGISGLVYESDILTPIISEEFCFPESVSRLVAERLYELARDISHFKNEIIKGTMNDDKHRRFEAKVKESNILAEDLKIQIIHAPRESGYGFIIVLPSGKTNNPENLGWEVYQWKQKFIDIKNTVDMDGLSW